MTHQEKMPIFKLANNNMPLPNVMQQVQRCTN